MNKVSFAPELYGLQFLEARTGVNFVPYVTPHWFTCTVFDPQDRVLAACVGEWKTLFEIDFSVAIDDPRAISRRLLKTIFNTLFSVAPRIVGRIDPTNHRAIKGARRLGFKYAGFLRQGLDGDRDALIFDMLRDDCPWLPGYSGGTIIIHEPDIGGLEIYG